MGAIDVVVGGQFGSEAKGHVTQQLIRRRQGEGRRVLTVRVAGPNAGHTVYDHDFGGRWPMRQVPVGFSVQDPGKLAIASGSEIDLPVLLSEIDRLSAAGLLHEKQLWVDLEATVLDESHHDIEAVEQLTERIGSTGKGVGAARAMRALRRVDRLADRPAAIRALVERGVVIGNTLEIMSEYTGNDGSIVIEGTQGFGLGQHSGYYPTVTSSDCRAIDFLAMAGLSPWAARDGILDRTRIWVVFRPFPIRVAGESGPLANETTWEALGLEPEQTTVTQKVRRVGLWDAGLARAAIQANGGGGEKGWGKDRNVRAVMTMLDQVFPHTAGAKRVAGLRGADEPQDQESAVGRWLAARANEIDCPFDLVTTSPTTAVWLR